jgi:predicted nuclease with TOPRIM domain
MTKQEFDDKNEQLEGELEEARDLLRQAEEDGNRRMINQAQNEISRIVRKMSNLKSNWNLEQ